MSSYTVLWSVERVVELGGVQRLVREQHMWPGMTEEAAKKHMSSLLAQGYMPFVSRSTAIVNQQPVARRVA